MSHCIPPGYWVFQGAVGDQHRAVAALAAHAADVDQLGDAATAGAAATATCGWRPSQRHTAMQ